MAIKKLFILLIIFILCPFFVFAQDTPQESVEEGTEEQEAEQLNYYIDRSGAEPRFIQRLIWEEDEYVFRYVVFVEKQQETGYIHTARLETKENFAEISLTPGWYRYRLEVYDLFDELSHTTRWRDFEVILALQPSLTSYSPRAFYLDEDEVWEISLRGQNLIPRSEFFLVQDNKRIRPQSHESEGNSSHLVFSGGSLSPGEYDIYVINPGGLDAYAGKFTIANRKPFDLNLSFGYAPIIPIVGFLFDDYTYNGNPQEAPFIGDFYPLGVSARISFIPIKRVWGNMGIEASGSITIMEQGRDFYAANVYFINTHLSWLYQRYFFKKRFSVNINIGAGITTLIDFHYKYSTGSPTEKTIVTYPSAIGGLSFMVFASKRIFINFGADAIHMFTPPEDTPMPFYIRPFVGVGIQL